MKAVVIESHGGREKLQYKEVLLPEVGPREVLVKVHTCGLNHLDLFVREGKLPVPVALPRILGLEITGEVWQTGPAVTRFHAGNRVAALSRVGCGRCEYCERGEENLCLQSRSLGLSLDGGYAEYAVVPEKNLFLIPDSVSYLQASGAPLSGLTAWHMLVTRAGIRQGETVLVVSGGSSVGSFAIQIAKLYGCQVMATVGDPAKVEKARKLGADHVILSREEKVAEAVRKLTRKRGVDVVFEHVGAVSWEESVNALARNGRLVICGAHTGSQVTLDLWKLFSKQISILGSYYGTARELADLLEVMAEGKLTTVVHARFPLQESREAHAVLEERKNFGKVILEVS